MSNRETLYEVTPANFTDKAMAVNVTVEAGSKAWKELVWFPNSMRTGNKVPGWLILKKIDEIRARRRYAHEFYISLDGENKIFSHYENAI